MSIPFYSETNFNKNTSKNFVIESLAVAPNNPLAGQIYRNTEDNEIYWFDGTEWRLFGSGSGGVGGAEVIIPKTGSTASAWLGNTIEETLEDGKQILYYAKDGSVNNSTLTLTLSTGTDTDALPIYSYSNNRVNEVTSEGKYHYLPGSFIRMTYKANFDKDTGATLPSGGLTGWWIDGEADISKLVQSSDSSVKDIRAIALNDYQDLKDNSEIEDNTIYEIYDDNGSASGNFNIYGIFKLPEHIANWLLTGNTPSSSVLTAYMQMNTNTINNYVQNGIILKTTYTDSSNNIITYFFNINYTVDGSTFSYDFDCLNDSSKSFYIFYDGSKFLWNTESACLVGTTIVYTNKGIKFIKDVEIGDKVLSYNIETQKEEFKPVNNIIAHNAGIIYRIELMNDIIECTYDEPFIMNTNNIVQAQCLKMYDKFFSLNGEEEIKHVTQTKNKQMVYDLSVEGNYNYFVGKNKILVATEKITKKEE